MCASHLHLKQPISARAAVLGELDLSMQNSNRLQELYQTEHARRKIAHNKLVEMMGNIRVICRVRPINKTEIKSGLGQDCTAYPSEGADENIIIKTPKEALVTTTGKGGSNKKGDKTEIDPDDPGQQYEFDTVKRRR